MVSPGRGELGRVFTPDRQENSIVSPVTSLASRMGGSVERGVAFLPPAQLYSLGAVVLHCKNGLYLCRDAALRKHLDV